MRQVFVDTWAWAASADVRDPWHIRAQAAITRLVREQTTFVTTNSVVHEAVTLSRRRLELRRDAAAWDHNSPDR